MNGTKYKGTMRLHNVAHLKVSSSKQDMSEHGRKPVPLIDIHVIEEDGSYFEIHLFGEDGGEITTEIIDDEIQRKG